MHPGIHYNQAYSPVASWNSVQMLVTLNSVHGWHTKQINFLQAFEQASVEKTLYLRIPAGFEIVKGDKFQRLCPPDSFQHLWSEAGWLSLEPLPCQESGKRTWTARVGALKSILSQPWQLRLSFC
jgi:hypothetical protein